MSIWDIIFAVIDRLVSNGGTRYFVLVTKWFFVSVSLSPLWLARLKIKPTDTEQNHRDTEAQR